MTVRILHFFEKIRQREGELGRRHVTRGLQVVI